MLQYWRLMGTIETTSPTEGTLFWITGMAGAGKTTIARCLVQQLRMEFLNTVSIDGDVVRSLFRDLGHTPAERLENAWRIARLSHMLSSQGIHVVCATVSLYKEVRDWLRENAPGYREVFINPSIDTLERRDQKGLYSGAASGDVANVAGVNLEVEFPKNPDLVISNDLETDDFSEHVAQIRALMSNPCE